MDVTASGRFTCEAGHRVHVQVPASRAEALLAEVLRHADLKWGDYDRVHFASAPGVQGFRSLPGGRNPATAEGMTVACTELSFFLPDRPGLLEAVLHGLYHAHPYEEPVIFVTPATRTLHVRGQDEDNPNRFWNRPTEDWVPPLG
ncbi:hypothetical protein FDP22_03385 [Paroceanicella profunda]|uniref:Uncharacterized protein n=1 Tax=Paroceanicella profunda TaxID=2579971 RepID=A0A5B8FG94_9RHOB|nr:hypothetical protein [Paroceanicella profunda]QDL90911.1 hypothetical protein FDP22_03385 [Paroceanicella profunda]